MAASAVFAASWKKSQKASATACSSQPVAPAPAAHAYAPKAGYFWFGNGNVYKATTWVDAATGVSSLGNWSGSGNWGGWDLKAIQLDSGSKTYREYVYMGSNATWAGTTCTGVAAVKYDANVHASCLPESMVAATGKTYAMKDDIAWVLDNRSLTWHPCLNAFADPANPPDGWTWDGSSWIEVPPTT